MFEKLEYVPASLRVIETARVKYACPQCHEGVIEAAAPPQAVEESLAREGLLAHVVVPKYVDHLPLYRLSCIFFFFMAPSFSPRAPFSQASAGPKKAGRSIRCNTSQNLARNVATRHL
jgi:transposase